MLIVTPNLTTDRTVELDTLVPGGVHRTGEAVETLGGKGVNVARVGRALGRSAPVVGFVPLLDADRLERLAAEEGAELVAVATGGRVRAATVLIERSGRVTVLNEPGPRVHAADWDRLLETVAERCAEHASLSCLGSLPPGSPPDAYGRCVTLGHRAGLLIAVDAAGQALEQALPAEPDIVTPNLAEAEAVLSGSGGVQLDPVGPEVVERAAAAALALVGRGARRAAVTAGRHGVVLADGSGVTYCASPAVRVRNATGAGDSFVGGLVDALERGEGYAEALRAGVATAAASCEQQLAGGIDPARVRALLDEVAPVHLEPTGAGGSERAGGGAR